MKNNNWVRFISVFLAVIMLISACTSASPSHDPRPRGWEITDDLVAADQNVQVSVLQTIVMPKHITLICAISVSGPVSQEAVQGFSPVKNQAAVLGEEDKILGQVNVTEIERFTGGSLVALTFLGDRQGTLKPKFSMRQMMNINNGQVFTGQWELTPVEMFPEGSDRGGMFATGVETATFGNVTISSRPNDQTESQWADTQSKDFFGGPKGIASFRIMVKQSDQISWLYLLVTEDGQVRKISEEEYQQIPNTYGQ